MKLILMVKEGELKPYTSAVTREIVHGPVLPQERCLLPTTTCKMQQPDKQILASLHFTFIKICNHLQYKALNDLAPSFTTELLNPYCTFRSLRSTGQGLLSIPYSRHKTKEGCAFAIRAPSLWNYLTQSCWVCQQHLRTHSGDLH